MEWKITGFAILAAFYGIYLLKMFLQSRKGIQTTHMGRGEKQGSLLRTELLMVGASCLVIPAQVLSVALGWSALPEWGRWGGTALAALGVGVFGTAVYTMRDSWRVGVAQQDKTELVTVGIYRYSRNPAFLGFDLTFAGILLMFCNWLLLAATGFFVVTLHMQILQEEAHLEKSFGEAYVQYTSRVKRYLGQRKTR